MSCASVLPKVGWLAVPLLFTLAFSAAAREPFVIIDANGKTIGPILDPFSVLPPPLGSITDLDSHWVDVPFRVGDRRIVLTVHRSGYAKNGSLYFESTDCTGQPYLHTETEDLLTPTFVRAPRNTLYVPDGPYVYVTARSHIEPSTLEGERCNSLYPFHDPFRVARPVVNLDDLFTPPFRVSASPDVVDLSAPAR